MRKTSYSTAKKRLRTGWQSLRVEALARSSGKCEFCFNPFSEPPYYDLHHRWYPEHDTMANLMAVCSQCHKAIHKGGKIKPMPNSLAALNDLGMGDTKLWREYLNK